MRIRRRDRCMRQKLCRSTPLGHLAARRRLKLSGRYAARETVHASFGKKNGSRCDLRRETGDPNGSSRTSAASNTATVPTPAGRRATRKTALQRGKKPLPLLYARSARVSRRRPYCGNYMRYWVPRLLAKTSTGSPRCSTYGSWTYRR